MPKLMNEYCSNLDTYLLGDLSPAEAAAFVGHLHECKECREAIEQQQWINGLLQASPHLETQVPPPHLASDLQVVLARRESVRKRVIPIALAIAATLLIAATSLLIHSGNRLSNQVATTDASSTPSHPQAMFAASDGTIAVPIKSTHPDVTIVRLYPAFRPHLEQGTAVLEPETFTERN